MLREKEILRAVLEELARSDYGALTFERVAARAGVNKTTVYRHWETKAQMVRSALLSCTSSLEPPPTTGTLRGDLLRAGRQMIDFCSSFEGQCLMRLRLLHNPDPALAGVVRELQQKQMAHLAVFAEVAIARGEVAPDMDFRLMMEMLFGTLFFRLAVKNEPVDDVIIARTVDVLLDGVSLKSGGAPPAHGRRVRGRAS